MDQKTKNRAIELINLGYSLSRVVELTGCTAHFVRTQQLKTFNSTRTCKHIHEVIREVMLPEFTRAVKCSIDAETICRIANISKYILSKIIDTEQGLISLRVDCSEAEKLAAKTALSEKINTFGTPGSEAWEYNIRRASVYATIPVSIAPGITIEKIDDDLDDDETAEVPKLPSSLETKLGSDIMRQAAVAYLYTKMGFSIRGLGKFIGVSHETIRQDLRRAGCRLRGVGRAGKSE